MVPTKLLPTMKLVLPGRDYKVVNPLGIYKTAEECAAAALDDYWCDNRNFITWSYHYPRLLTCGCCHGGTAYPLYAT